MRKVKIKLTHAELSAIYADLFNNVPPTAVDYHTRLMVAVLIKLYMRLGPRVTFTYPGKKSLSLEADIACALVLWVHSIQRNASNFIDNLYIRLATQIDQQLA